MATDRSTPTVFEDAKVSTRIKLSAAWASLVLCYIYNDHFALYRPGMLQTLMTGALPTGPMTQGMLLLITASIVIPCLMVFLSLVLPLRTNRWANIVWGAFYTVFVLATITAPGTWTAYMFLGVIECVVTAMIVWIAWTWPKRTPNPPSAEVSQLGDPG